MNIQRLLKSAIFCLLLAAFLLPIFKITLYWITKVLIGMNDHAGSELVHWAILVIAILWLIDLVLLILLTGVQMFLQQDQRENDSISEDEIQ